MIFVVTTTNKKGKPFTSIEPGSGLNNVCLVPNSGMLFMANESPKILVYYIPVSFQSYKTQSQISHLRL